ncbi:MAG TPA: hypothetical protein PLC59_07665 [Bacteroidales bacterium]|jgi:peptidoglycan hydrolase CwlO-like protein|nr:hypothetical protein [Bacteroidales bacterium]HQI45917.1 hypothetical protein [Bacteroidales bacterium]
MNIKLEQIDEFLYLVTKQILKEDSLFNPDSEDRDFNNNHSNNKNKGIDPTDDPNKNKEDIRARKQQIVKEIAQVKREIDSLKKEMASYIEKVKKYKMDDIPKLEKRLLDLKKELLELK